MKLLGHDIATVADIEKLEDDIIRELETKAADVEARVKSVELGRKFHIKSTTVAIIISVIALVVAILK